MTQTFKKAADVAAHITTLVEKIKIADGYQTDIGVAVHRGKLKIDDEMIPCAVILEGDDRIGDSVNREEVKVSQVYVLGGYVACDPDNPNDAAHKVISDIKKVLFTGSAINGAPNFDRKVLAVRYMGRNIGPRSDGKAFVFAAVYIEVDYAEKLADA